MFADQRGPVADDGGKRAAIVAQRQAEGRNSRHAIAQAIGGQRRAAGGETEVVKRLDLPPVVFSLFLKPVHAGDTLTTVWEITGLTPKPKHDGGIVAMPNAAVYASSKAAVVTMTECLHHQLRTMGSKIGASVLLPSGGLLLTGLWTADRNRPADLARERPRSRPGMTAEAFREHMAAQGHEIPVMPLDEVASWVVEGPCAGLAHVRLFL